MALFNNNTTQGVFVDPNSPQFLRRKYDSQYKTSRYNLLLVSVLTVINIFSMTFQTGRYYPFSAYVPTALLDLTLYLCGKYPAEVYEGVEPFEFFDSSLLTVAIIVSAIIAIAYLVCFLFSSKKRVGFMITGLSFIGIDTLLMFALGGISVDLLLDIAFHAWVIISLSMGISAHNKLKKLPVDIPASFEDISSANSGVENNETVQPQNALERKVYEDSADRNSENV